jgi:hypothetical protein
VSGEIRLWMKEEYKMIFDNNMIAKLENIDFNKKLER